MKAKIKYSRCMIQVQGCDMKCFLCGVLVRDGERHECKSGDKPLKHRVTKVKATLTP